MIKFYEIILFVMILSCASDFTNAQSENKITVGLSSELMGGGSWGSIASISGEIDYSLNNNISIGVLYRHGTENTLQNITFAEYRPEPENYVTKYNEMSSFFIYSYDDSYSRAYIGSGIGINWGDKVKAKSYLLLGVPFVIGAQLYIVKDFRIGLKFTGSIIKYTNFKGVGLDLFLNI
jgi:hypothetical protein